MAIETEFAELHPLSAASGTRAATRRPGPSLYLIAIYAILVLAALIALVPFFYVISTSLKDTYSLFKYPPEWIPSQPTLENFRSLLEENPFGRWMLNSLIVASVVTAIKVVIDSMAGYAFAKMSFPGKEALFLVVLMTLMVPFAATLIPLFIIVRNLGLTNTYPGLILPALASPIGIFMMRQFIETLPNDLENAARLDGCSEFQIFRRVILPLIKPGLVVLGVFTFMNQWTSYLGRWSSAPARICSPSPSACRACAPFLPSTGASSPPAPSSPCCPSSSSSSSPALLHRRLHRRSAKRMTAISYWLLAIGY